VKSQFESRRWIYYVMVVGGIAYGVYFVYSAMRDVHP
jgi:hypothetical protein